MKSQTILKILNPILFIAVVVQFATVAIQKVLYSEWASTAHSLTGYLIALLIFLHIVYNWGWIKNNFFKKKLK